MYKFVALPISTNLVIKPIQLSRVIFDTGESKPRFIRVNTLKMDVQTAINELSEKYAVSS